jgi:hypothetical protein
MGAGAVTALLRRLGAFLLEPAEHPASPRAEPRAPLPAAPLARPTRVAVLGAPADVPAVAAACAGELRARHRASAALVCLWRPGGEPPPGGLDGADRGIGGDADDRPDGVASPAGATTPGARRVAAALAADGLRATACGRLAWLALPDPPGEAASVLRRGLALAGVPVAIAVAGPRPEELEPILATADIAVAVLPAGTGEALRDLAIAHLPGAERGIVGPLPPGPPRWAALAGLTRLRSLPGGAA